MNVVIIPGLIGHPEEKTFEILDKKLSAKGDTVIKIAWPYFPSNLEKYSFTETIAYTRTILQQLDMDYTIILGFSMGGVIACYLASEFQPAKLGLIIAPYQVGSDDELTGKYKEWMQKGYRDMSSSIYGKLRIPFAFIQDARKYNAMDIIEKVHCPILFIVGEKDDKTPPEITVKLFEKANEPKTWQEIPSMEHKYQYQSPEMLRNVNELIIGFAHN